MVEEMVHAATRRAGESGGFSLGLGRLPKHFGLELVTKSQRVLAWNGLIVGPHRDSGTGNAQRVGKSLLGPVCGNGVALIDIHVAGLSGC